MIHPGHRMCVVVPPSPYRRLMCQPAVARLNVEIVLDYMNPASWPNQQPHIPNVRCPSAAFDTRANAARVDEVVCLGLKHLGIVEAVVQVVAAKAEIIWLISNKHGIDIDSSDLFRSARRITAAKFTHLALFKFFSTLYCPVATTVSTFQHLLGIRDPQMRRKECTTEQPEQQVMLGRQSVFLQLIIRHWYTVYSLVDRDFLENPSMYGDTLEVCVHGRIVFLRSYVLRRPLCDVLGGRSEARTVAGL